MRARRARALCCSGGPSPARGEMMNDPPTVVTAPIPEALRASVLERVRRLDRRARTILLCASVIGRRFESAS